MSEQELTVRPTAIQLGDYLHVGHQWWGKVKKLTYHERLDLFILTVGGMEFPIVLVPNDQVTVRRG